MKSVGTIFLLILSVNWNWAQEIGSYNVIINEIGNLEGRKDPKCHATASRLENFMFGTPLSSEARVQRINFQQDFVKYIWVNYSRNLPESDSADPDLFKSIEKELLTYLPNGDGYLITFNSGKTLEISKRDLRQYSSVAYALRAILSVEQSFLFESQRLTHLDQQAVEYFKNSIDLAVLSVLKTADLIAKNENSRLIEQRHLDQAVAELFPQLSSIEPKLDNPKNTLQEQRDILELTIKQKLNAYDQYNQVNQSVFFRNIQVYFSRIPWPVATEKSDSLKVFFTETVIQLSKDLIEMAQSYAIENHQKTIEYQDAYEAVQKYMPHEVTAFEDVVFYPNLTKDKQIVIESYDFDAFRDSGWHWQYLLSALNDSDLRLGLSPNPFALEMIVEGIAQFAVLVLRVAGDDALSNHQSHLEVDNFHHALQIIQDRITLHLNTEKSDSNHKNEIISSQTTTHDEIRSPFEENAIALGIAFQHKSSDWLSRLIRSYTIKEDENIARISIPPAFSGSGIATEDVDGDGWVDVLLLSGLGNKLYKNLEGNGFKDITHAVGLDAFPEGQTEGEPRQPIIADFDNDGHQDIFITYANAPHQMFINLGDGHFELKTLETGLGGQGQIGGPATALDVNNDGLLDLYIGNFGNYINGTLPTLKRTNTNASPNQLFLNLGNFKFEDITPSSGVGNTGWTQAVGHADINGDGWQDIIVGNDFGKNAYYINQQDNTFIDQSYDLNTDKPSYSMGIGISDLNRDDVPDFYISNIVVMEKDDKYVLPSEDTPLHFDPNSLATMRVVEANDLFVSHREKDSEEIRYINSDKIGRGFASTGWSWDADFFDYDLDGDDDLYCLTGMNPYSIYGKNTNDYYASSTDEKTQIFADSQGDQNIMFKNEGGLFEVLKDTGGLDYFGTSRSAAYFDFDNDGDLDIVTNEYHGRSRLFVNKANVNTSNWIKIKLIGSKDKNSRDAIGAKVILTTPNGNRQIKSLYSTTGYMSCHPKILHFGLGESASCSLEVVWPNGEKTFKSIKNANKLVSIRQ